MKKTVGILVILLIIVIGIGKFFYSDGMFLNIFIKEFNTTVNIVTKPEIADKTIIELQKIANKNDLSFIKEEYIPKNSRFDKQKIKIYLSVLIKQLTELITNQLKIKKKELTS